MKAFKTANKMLFILCVSIVSLAFVAVVSFGIAATPEANSSIARDLATISGLSEETINEIYVSLDDWEAVKENIFVYKRIFSLIQDNQEEYNNVFSLLQKYKSTDLLAIYEFIDSNSKNFRDIEQILSQYDSGMSLEEIFTDSISESIYESYNVYKPADKKLIRKWLAAGYLPNDIINADSIAMERDMEIKAILNLKNENITWDEIKENLDYKLEEEMSIAVSIKRHDNIEIVTAKNHKDLVKKVNNKAKKIKETGKQKILIDKYKSNKKLNASGLNKNEIVNVIRISERSGADIEEILEYRKSAKNWKEVINKYIKNMEGNEVQ